MQRIPWFSVVAAAIGLGCGGGGAADLTAPAPSLSAVELAPCSGSIPVGGSQQLVVTAKDASGQPLKDVPAPAFTSSDATKAAVSTNGTVTAVAPGTAVISASVTMQGTTRTASCNVTITAPSGAPGGTGSGLHEVSTVATSFAPPTITIPVNDSVVWHFAGAIHNVTFGGTQPPGGNIPDQQIGAVVARQFTQAGTYNYECTRHSGMTGTVVVQAGAGPTPTFTSLAVSPATPAIAVGQTVQLAATPLDQNGSPLTGLPAPTFATADPAKAAVSATGLVTGAAAGTVVITASLSAGGATHTGSATVTVQSLQASGLTVTTPNLTFTPGVVQLPAGGGTVTWQFSGATHNVTFTGPTPAAGNIPDQAIGNAVSRTFTTAGTYAYECTRHTGMHGSVVVAGATPPAFTTLTVAPTTPAIGVGGTVQLAVTALDQFGTVMTGLAAPTFVSADPTKATVSPGGLVKGVGPGTVVITASITAAGATHTAAATVSVTSPQATGATVTTPNRTFSPGTVTIAAGGTVTWQFSGDVHNVTFNGAAPAGGGIPDQQPGNAVSRTFSTAGTFSYACTRHGGMTGTVVVQAAPPGGGGGGAPTFTSLALAPASAGLAVGGTLQLTATPLDQNGSPMTGLPAPTFTSSAPAIATVSAAGTVTGVAAGPATITASLTASGVTHAATATMSVGGAGSGGALVTTTADNKFLPDDVRIPPGGSVTWQFAGATHNVTFTNRVPPGGNIGDTPPGTSATRTFSAVGDYDYVCTRHPDMKGRVRVE